MTPLEDTLYTLDHSQQKRAYFADLILSNPTLFPELLKICAMVDSQISCKASWGLEFVCRKRLETILPYLNQLLAIVPNIYQHPAVRPMSKIFEYLVIAYYKEKSIPIRNHVSLQHREKITEICFDWLITEQKVAPKAYAMTSLYLLGTEFDWVHPELKITLENNYTTGSAAYKARSRMILKRI